MKPFRPRRTRQRPGPTGKYPLGKLNPEDRGELAVSIKTERGHIRIDFGTSVTWVSLPPAEARSFARAVLERADKLDPPVEKGRRG